MFSLIAQALPENDRAEFLAAIIEFDNADSEARKLDREISGIVTHEQREMRKASNARFFAARRALAKFGADPLTF